MTTRPRLPSDEPSKKLTAYAFRALVRRSSDARPIFHLVFFARAIRLASLTAYLRRPHAHRRAERERVGEDGLCVLGDWHASGSLATIRHAACATRSAARCAATASPAPTCRVAHARCASIHVVPFRLAAIQTVASAVHANHAAAACSNAAKPSRVASEPASDRDASPRSRAPPARARATPPARRATSHHPRRDSGNRSRKSAAAGDGWRRIPRSGDDDGDDDATLRTRCARGNRRRNPSNSCVGTNALHSADGSTCEAHTAGCARNFAMRLGGTTRDMPPRRRRVRVVCGVGTRLWRPTRGTRRRRTIPGRRGPRKTSSRTGRWRRDEGREDGGARWRRRRRTRRPRRRRAGASSSSSSSAGTSGFARSGRSPRLDLAGERAARGGRFLGGEDEGGGEVREQSDGSREKGGGEDRGGRSSGRRRVSRRP